MAEPRASQDRLVPSLLDRLIDQDPDLERDQPSGYGQDIRTALRRDLEMLLNTRCRPDTPHPDWEELDGSLLQLGVEDFFSANLVTDHQRQRFVAALQARIAKFEPRLGKLEVKLVPDPIPGRRTLRLRIEALYRARPGLPPLVLETQVDPVAGHFSVLEGGRG